MADTPPKIPDSSKPEDLGFTPQKMSRWFNPRRLFELAGKVLVSGAFGTYMDKREIQSALNKAEVYDFSQLENDEGFWIDYTADLGDGFDSTFTIAKILAQDSLQTSNDIVTHRGDLLIMGGDEVYPYACRETYRDRLAGPYKAALPWLDEKEHPHLFAIPGNHDWFDGLTSFLRLFCQDRWIGAWKTCQSRSYFAIKLPHDWWLFGVDIQFQSDIDRPQRDYFDDVIEQLNTNSKVILATAVPDWINEPILGEEVGSNLNYLQNKIEQAKATVHFCIAGDSHHYMRYSYANNNLHKITSGGGGAFLHGTHALPCSLELTENGETREYERDDNSIYPTQTESRKTTLGNIRFPWMNWEFSLFMGGFYLLVLWIMQSASRALSPLPDTSNLMMDIGRVGNSSLSFCEVLDKFTHVLLHSPASIILLLVLVGGLIGFAEPPVSRHKRTMGILRIILGVAHAFGHIMLIVLIGWLLAYLNLNILGLKLESFWQVVLFITECLVIGTFTSGLLIGFYLIVVNNLLRFNKEAAFSSNRIQDYKNFCRFHIDKDGTLTFYPIGVRKIESNWILNKHGQDGDTWFVTPENKSMSDYVHLIEGPIKIGK